MSQFKSTKGFLAIDIDGTALIQKIDKNPAYGLLHSQSNMRLALINYIQQAQKEGYDLIILTARPQQIERFFGIFNLGTKSTQSIVDNLNEYGVEVKDIERVPAGLKGAKMQQILDQYPQGAVGMLFDDQLKQVNDVKQQNNEYLIAYDINSKKDLDSYVQRVNLNSNNIFHPDLIIARLLATHEKLKSLQNGCEQLDSIYSKEKQLTQDVIHELCIRAFEAEYRDYQPEIAWITTTTRHMQAFLDKLNAHQEFTTEEVEKATKDIFGTKKLDRVIPNSNCDVVVKQFLEESARNAVIFELSCQCDNFLEEIKSYLSDDSELHCQQIEVVSMLRDNLKNTAKVKAIEQFAETFRASKDLIQKYPGCEGFIESIRCLLAKAPIIGVLFQTEKERITDKINNNVASAYKTIVNEVETIT